MGDLPVKKLKHNNNMQLCRLPTRVYCKSNYAACPTHRDGRATGGRERGDEGQHAVQGVSVQRGQRAVPALRPPGRLCSGQFLLFLHLDLVTFRSQCNAREIQAAFPAFFLLFFFRCLQCFCVSSIPPAVRPNYTFMTDAYGIFNVGTNLGA